MPINNALTPEGQNALGVAFGYYPQLKKYRQFNDPVASSEMPLQFMRGRFASTMGAIPDLMNLKRSLLPAEAVRALEAYGQIAPEVPYGSQYFQENLPLPPQGPAQQMAGNVGSVMPLSPMEALQAARLARQAALAGGKVAQKGARLVGEELNAAMMGERQGTMLGAITPQPRFIFVGESSKTWNKADATKAIEMEKAGAKPEDILATTGTFRGPEGKLRQEISDLPARANFPPQYSDVLNAHSQFEYGKPYHSLPFGETGLGEARKKISELADIDMERYKTAAGALPHPDLYKAYSELAKTKVEPYRSKDISGSYQKTEVSEGSLNNPKTTLTNENITAGAPSEEELKSVLLHEAQHAIQAREGFARGGSPGSGQDAPFVYGVGKSAERIAEIEKLLEKTPYASKESDVLSLEREQLTKKAEIEAALEGYRRLAGEAEARATQARLGMTAEQRRAKFPYESYDVPLNQLIIRK